MNVTLRAALIPLSLVALSLSSAASSQSTGGHAGHATPSQPQSGAAHAGHAMTDLGGLGALRGRAFDRAYLSMMIPHHQAAVEMARAALPVSRDATVKAWATAVIRDQQREINQMNALLKGLGGTDAAMAASMKRSMGSMGDLVRKARNPDVAFVQGMLPHHASAIDMANLALQRGQDARILGLSKAIITAQAAEMLDYRTWLGRRGL
jgi:uncharacterized protein (DUF305 family)